MTLGLPVHKEIIILSMSLPYSEHTPMPCSSDTSLFKQINTAFIKAASHKSCVCERERETGEKYPIFSLISLTREGWVQRRSPASWREVPAHHCSSWASAFGLLFTLWPNSKQSLSLRLDYLQTRSEVPATPSCLVPTTWNYTSNKYITLKINNSKIYKVKMKSLPIPEPPSPAPSRMSLSRCNTNKFVSSSSPSSVYLHAYTPRTHPHTPYTWLYIS